MREPPDARNDIRLVVFDLAGTTVHDGGEVPIAFTRAMGDHGVAIDTRTIEDLRGSSKREAINRLVPGGPDRARIADAAYRSFRDHLRTLYADGGIRPIAGAEKVFARLRRLGFRVALNTGFDRDITDLLLDALAWRTGAVDAVVCGDDVRHGRPAPDLIHRAMKMTGVSDVSHVANVGDTVLDLTAGHNAGVAWNIGVCSGAHTRARLEEAPHTHILESVADLVDALGLP
jgi:phosphonatase-like hydrolase